MKNDVPEVSQRITDFFNSLNSDTNQESFDPVQLIERARGQGIADESLESFLQTWDRTGDIGEQYEAHLQGATTVSQRFAATLKSAAANMGIMLAVSLAINAAVTIWDEVNITVAESQAKVDELSASLNSLKGEYEALNTKDTALLSESELKRLKYLENKIKLEERLLEIQQHNVYSEELGNGFTDMFDKDNQNTKQRRSKDYSINTPSSDGKALEVMIAKYTSAGEEVEKYSDAIKQADSGNFQYEKGLIGLIDNTTSYSDLSNALTDSYLNQTKAMETMRMEQETIFSDIAGYQAEYDGLQEKIDSGLLTPEEVKSAKSHQDFWNNQISGAKEYYNIIDNLLVNTGSVNDITNVDERALNINEEELRKSFNSEEIAILASLEFDKNASIEDLQKLLSTLQSKIEDSKPLTIQTALSGLESMSDGLDSLGAIHEDIANKKDFDFGALVDDKFVAAFKDYDKEYSAFIDTVTKSPTDISACKSAFDDLSTAWLYGQEPLRKINDETYDLTVKWLEQKGVANATEVATYALAKSKEASFASTHQLKEGTEEEISALQKVAEQCGITGNAFYVLAATMITADDSQLGFSQQINALDELATRAGIASGALGNLNVAKLREDDRVRRAAADRDMDIDAYIAKIYGNSIVSTLGNKTPPSPKVNYAPKSSSSGSKTEKYVAEIDQFKELSDAVADVETRIEQLNQVMGATDNLTEQISLQGKLIGLYQEQKNALTALNQAKDKEIQANVSKLKNVGFDITYDPTAETLQIKNREHLNSLSQKTIKEYESLIEKTEQMNDANKDSAKSFTDLSYKINDATKEISNLKHQMYEESISDGEHLLALLDKRDGYESTAITEIGNLMAETLTEWERLVNAGYNTNKETIQKLEKAWMDYYDNRLEKEKEIREKQLEDKDKVISAVTSVLDDEIKKLQKEAEELENLNKQREDAIKLQKAEADLDKARNQRVNKVLRKYKGFEWDTNDDDIADKESALADLKYQAAIDALNEQVKKLEEYKELWGEVADAHEKEVNRMMASQVLGKNWEEKILSMRKDTLIHFKDDYISIEEEIEQKTRELAEHTAEEYATMVEQFRKMGELMNSSTSGSGRSWYVDSNGNAPKDAVIGDKVVTSNGTYQIVAPNTPGAGYNPKTDRWNIKVNDDKTKIPENLWGTEIRTSNDKLSNVLGYNIDKTQEQTNNIARNIIASGLLTDQLSGNSKITTEQVKAAFESMESVDGNSYEVGENTVKLEGVTYSIDDLTNSINNMAFATSEEDIVKNGSGFGSNAEDDKKLSFMSKEDREALKSAQDAYNTAKKNGNKDAMDAAHEIAESIRDKYGYSGGSDGSGYVPNNPRTSADRLNEYTSWRDKAEEYGASKEYKDRLDAAIAREESGSGHKETSTIDKNGLVTTIVSPTDKSESSMTADQIRAKNQNNNKAMNKLDGTLGTNAKTTGENTDALTFASDSTWESTQNIVDSNASLSDGIRSFADSVSKMSFLNNSFGGYDDSSGSSGRYDVSTGGGSSMGGVAGSALGGAIAGVGGAIVGGILGSLSKKKKKAIGGLNLPSDIYNVDEAGLEMIIEPQHGRYVKLGAGSGVVPADITERLMKMATNPTELLKDYMPIMQSANINMNASTPMPTNYITIQKVELANVRDIDGFAQALPTLPMLVKQYASRR